MLIFEKHLCGLKFLPVLGKSIAAPLTVENSHITEKKNVVKFFFVLFHKFASRNIDVR